MKPVLAMLLLAISLVGCAASRPNIGAAITANQRAPFVLTFWCGPPQSEIDQPRAAQIAQAGFTTIASPCEGGVTEDGNRRVLDVAARNGLKAWLFDPRISPGAIQNPGWQDTLQQAARAYGSHPALEAFFIEDEPSAGEFPTLVPVLDELRQVDPTMFGYVNLLPDYVRVENYGADTYEEYLEQFVAAVDPAWLSYDYYPFGKERDRSSYFESLAVVRRVAQRHRIPFLVIVLAMPHGPYRDPTDGELAWQVFHPLAYGARGISYFAYWTPVHVAEADFWNFHDGMITNGEPTANYDKVARLNPVAGAIAEQLATFESVAVADSTGEVAPVLPYGPIEAINGDRITAGFFRDVNGREAVLLVNRDYRNAARISVQFKSSVGGVTEFDPWARLWKPLPVFEMEIEPGFGRLLRVEAN